jgi:hypothetical protein
LVGLFPTDQTSSQISVQISAYDRYLRKGVEDFLPPTATSYERALAICADDVIIQTQNGHLLEYFIMDRYKRSGILDSLKSILVKVLNRRSHITLQEATRNNFDSKIYSLVKCYLNKLQGILKRPPGLAEHRYLIYVERIVGDILAPWFVFKLLETSGGRIIIHLRSLFTHTVYQEDPYLAEFTPIAEPVIQCLESAQLIALDQYLEFIRAEILRDNPIGSHHYCFILPFRKFLESGGDPNLMPIIRSGSVQRRELTRLGLYRSGRIKCKAGCTCALPRGLKDMERKLEARMSSEPRALDQRAAIKRFFARNDANASGWGLRQSPAVLYQRMCLTSNTGNLRLTNQI